MNRASTYPVILLKGLVCTIALLFTMGQPLYAQGLKVDTKKVKCKGEANGEATVTGGKAPQPYTYKWSHNPGASAKTVSDLKAGMYHVTVTDAVGCTAVVDFEIDEPDDALGTILVTSDPNHDFCANTFEITVTAYGSGGTPQYHWPEGRVKTITGPGRYCFITYDKNNCIDVECTHMGEARTACRASSDPNDIVGPEGFSTLQWMSKFERHDYMIRFENDPLLATGPAQYVEVRHDVDPDINPLSVRLGAFGFGPFLFDVPENASFYQQRLDLTNELGIYLDVVGGLDVVANQVFWRLETIDPTTGLRPLDLTIGFLPPNDTLTNDGQGFVTFSALPKSSTVTRDSVSADAIIIFDLNEPITTNLWHNTLDALAPTSALGPLPDTSLSNIIPLVWTGHDDLDASGIATYTLFSSADSGPYIPVQEGITDTTVMFEGEYNVHYDFYIIAIDHTGNKEVKTTGEASTQVIPLKIIELESPLSDAQCILDTLHIDWSTILIDSVDIYISLDSGQTFSLIADSIPTAVSPYAWIIPDTASTLYAQLMISSTSDTVEKTGPLFSINILPEVEAGQDLSICINGFTNLIASGANMYEWSPVYALDEPMNYKSLAYPDTTTTYFVRGTNVFGCSNIDSLVVTVFPIYLDSVTHMMCNEDSVFVGGDYQTEPGFYTDYLAATTGCDSTVVTEVILTGPCAFPADQVYVDKDATGLNNGTSWANAFVDLQDALETVEYYVDVTSIWVAEGDYFPSIPSGRNASFTLRDSVKIFGGFVGTEILLEDRTGNETIVKLTGDLGTLNDSLDNAYHVIRIDSSCVDCVINSLTIKFGQGDGVNEQTYGAGLYVEGIVTLDGVTVERNTTLLDGAAIYNSGVGTLLTIKDCLFRLNTSSLARDILNTNGAEIRFEGMNTVED